jgi:NAD(P)-dependent dehydrogenase (short-subunit alcohol dehydrogenase family)
VRALVTGAARGLGLATAQRLHRDGARVVLLDVDAEVHARAAELAGPPQAIAVRADVGDETVLAAAFDAAIGHLGGIDVLVNCAGVGGPTTAVADTRVEDLRRVLDVNLIGAYVLCAAAVRVMVEQQTGGAIVNIGSILGIRGTANGSPYCVSKAAIGMLTQTLALEVAGSRIRVNAIAPGNMATAMHFAHLREVAAGAGTSFEEEVARIRASVPLGRHGTGEDVAGTVAWLISEDASYVTGQTIVVDGGVLPA